MNQKQIESIISKYQDATITLSYNEGTKMFRVILLTDYMKHVNNNRMKIIGSNTDLFKAFEDLQSNLNKFEEFYDRLTNSNNRYTEVFERLYDCKEKEEESCNIAESVKLN